jgi:phosphate transport system substrate-binding protein
MGVKSMKATANRLAIALGLLVTTSCTAASNSSTQSQQQASQQLIKVDGSSTVFPITQAIAREFQKTQTDKTQVTVGVSGTGGWF